MTSESIILGTKGLFLIATAGVLHVAGSIAQAVSEPTALVKSIEDLGPQGLLLLGVVYLYRANQKLEAEIRKLHEDTTKSTKEQIDLMKEQMRKSDESREKLYDAIRGALDK